MIEAVKRLERLRNGKGGDGRLARIERTVDAILKFLANMAEGEGIAFKVTRDKTSIAIHADIKDWRNILPAGTADNQVLKWNHRKKQWEAGWVTAVDPNEAAQADDFQDGTEEEITS